MAFPSNPLNGNVATVNGITYVYNSTKTAWLRASTTGANLTANSLSITSNIASTSSSSGALIVTGGAGIQGNINVGGYIVGNGSLLTGLPASYSNVQVATYLSSGTAAGNIVVPNIIANSFVSVDYLNGITLNYSTRRVNKVCQSFIFEEEAGILTPLNKTKVTFSTTGAQQTWVVPSGVTYIYVKMWGAGGSGGSSGGWGYGSPGGGGGHSRGLIPVTAGNTLYLVVGVGGQTNYAGSTTLMYGGGGGFYNNSDNRYAGSAGGMAAIHTASSVSQANALMIAGGGGGGGSSRAGWGNNGGAGGGTAGQQGGSPYDGKPAYAGGGGTQAAGGTAGTGSYAGSALAGGHGGTNGGNPYGGSGGGGYYGGGGGGYSESNTMAGGGGGSGYLASSVLLGGTFTGSGQHPAFYFDNDLSKNTDTYQNSQKFAWGGDQIFNSSQYTSIYGGGAYIVIYY